MRVEVDFELCESQAVCVGLAPTVFELSTDGNLTLLQAQPPEELRDALENAEAACPVGAIKVSD